MSADRHTTEQTAGNALSARVSASTPEVGVSGPSDPLNGPQNGAQRLGVRRDLEARAFNAVQPALHKAGQWLPMSARRAVANAVLAELAPELDALDRVRAIGPYQKPVRGDRSRGMQMGWDAAVKAVHAALGDTEADPAA
ncbi:hypothetical protein [Streptomyces sp. MJP52]|uniref:hypothetical protein n=1 Tax=Streptomyces sp. MJP52 TaxID=2940555 RepID=UPI0024771B88|nr:hypothetical protein [Streptomyces sp. MJP52]MDH6224324.1 hypothetical protein [Streptomyces sp. MJP52]